MRQPIPVLCLPFAGAGASFFSPWQSLDIPGLTVVPVQLPGREELIDDEPYTDVAAAVGGLADRLCDFLGKHSEVAAFGHSLGAVLAYELAILLESRGVAVARLFVSGSPGPSSARTRRVGEMSDEDFLTYVESLAGYRHEALDTPELRELVLPTLRADVEMHESYVCPTDARFAAPITVLRGAEDELVSSADTDSWSIASRGAVEKIEVSGGHMYLVDRPDAVLRTMAARLSARSPG